jgi:hypothetical protein
VQAQAEEPAVVVVLRELTYWDATYTGFVASNRFEKWPVLFTEAEDFRVTAAPDAEGLTTLIILMDASDVELARGAGTLASSQPAGSYYVQIQPETGSGFYSLTIRREEVTPPPPTQPSSTTVANPTSVKVGETAVVSVTLDNVPAEGYTSAEFTCTYDAAKVEVSSIVVGELFGADAATAINGPLGGTFIVAVAGSNGNRAMTGGTVFTFNAKGLVAGEATIGCQARVSKGDNLLTDVTSTAAILTITDEIVPPPPDETDGTLTGQVLAGKAVTVSLYNAENTLVGSVAANQDGTFSIAAPAGTYTVAATASGFLGAQGPATLTSNETSTKSAVTLFAGDIDGNNVIDQFDAMTIGMSYNTAAPAEADLNSDGVINVLDLELLAAHYRATGPINWP